MKLSIAERIVTKLTSGRLILTIMVGLAWCYAVFTERSNTELNAVFMLVLSFYFNRDKSQNK